MKRKNKFKVGQLITDKETLYQVIYIEKDILHVKVISSRVNYSIGANIPWNRDYIESISVPYDLKKPITRVKDNGYCFCENCVCKLHVDDHCIRTKEGFFCSYACLYEHLMCEEDFIKEEDLHYSEKVTVPLFELSEAQLELIKEQKNG